MKLASSDTHIFWKEIKIQIFYKCGALWQIWRALQNLINQLYLLNYWEFWNSDNTYSVGNDETNKKGLNTFFALTSNDVTMTSQKFCVSRISKTIHHRANLTLPHERGLLITYKRLLQYFCYHAIWRHYDVTKIFYAAAREKKFHCVIVTSYDVIAKILLQSFIRY